MVLSYVILFLVATGVILSAPVPINDFCTDNDGHVVCKGVWPTDRDLDFPVDNKVAKLDFSRVIFNSDHVRPLPNTLDGIAWLTFQYVTTTSDAGQPTLLLDCLQTLVQGLNLTNMRILELRNTPLIQLGKTSFKGFSTVRSLIIENGGLADIASDAFWHLAIESIVGDVGGPVFQRTGNLRRLVIFNDQDMSSFPWDSLSLMSKSLEEVEIYKNPALRNFRVPPDTRFVPPMQRLRTLNIYKNPLLTTLPIKMLNSIITADQAVEDVRDAPTAMDFTDNGVQCGSWNLQPLIEWNRWKDHDGKRSLKLQCLLHCGLVGSTRSYSNAYLNGIWTGMDGKNWTADSEPSFSSSSQLIPPCSEAPSYTTTTTTTTTRQPDLDSGSLRLNASTRWLGFIIILMLLSTKSVYLYK